MNLFYNLNNNSFLTRLKNTSVSTNYISIKPFSTTPSRLSNNENDTNQDWPVIQSIEEPQEITNSVPAQETQSQSEDSEERESDSTDKDSESPGLEGIALQFKEASDEDRQRKIQQIMSNTEEEITEYIDDRLEDRKTVRRDEREEFDISTIYEIDSIRETTLYEINYVRAEDDRNSDTDNSSDSGLNPPEDDNIHNITRNLISQFNHMVDEKVQDYEKIVDAPSENSDSSPGEENPEDSEMQDYESDSPEKTGGKRLRDDESMEDRPTKKIKEESSSESDNLSPLDYVLDKQQSEMMDVTDDIE